MAPIAKSRHLTCPLGPIDPYESLQIEITVTGVTLEGQERAAEPPSDIGIV